MARALSPVLLSALSTNRDLANPKKALNQELNTYLMKGDLSMSACGLMFVAQRVFF